MAEKLKTKQENATTASYKASYCIALTGEAHTPLLGAYTVKPVMTDIASCALDEKSIEKLKSFPLSNNMIARRIDDIAGNIEAQLIFRICDCDAFALQ